MGVRPGLSGKTKKTVWKQLKRGSGEKWYKTSWVERKSNDRALKDMGEKRDMIRLRTEEENEINRTLIVQT